MKLLFPLFTALLVLGLIPAETFSNDRPLQRSTDERAQLIQEAGYQIRRGTKTVNLPVYANRFVVSSASTAAKDFDNSINSKGVSTTYRLDQELGANHYTLTLKSDAAPQKELTVESFRDTLAMIRKDVRFDVVNPVFYDVGSGLDVVYENVVALKLRSEVDVQQLLTNWPMATFSGASKTIMTITATSTHAEAVFDIVNALYEQPYIDWAEAQFMAPIGMDYMPNDTLFSNMWHHDHYNQIGFETNQDIRSPQAWDVERGTSDVVIAIIDDGVEIGHPDLFVNLFNNSGETLNGIDDDGNGYIDDAFGWDFADNDNDPQPNAERFHGTSCAGLAAAVGDNNRGVVGSGMNCKHLPIKVVNTASWASSANLALAIRYAGGVDGAGNQVWRGADILSMSFHYPSSAVVRAALDDVAANGRNGLGCPMLAAAGNDASGFQGWFKVPVSNLQAGTYFALVEYYKDAADTGGSDRVWCAWVGLPDADETLHYMSGPDLPAGWSVGGDAPFEIVDDDYSHQYGRGPYILRSGAAGDNENSWFRTENFVLDTNKLMKLMLWISSEKGPANPSYPPSFNDGDWVFVHLYNVTLGSWELNYDLASGVPGDLRYWETDPIDTSSFPANQPGVMGVGAITDMGVRSHYSEYLDCGLDFMAPSGGGYEGVWTTDRVGTNGYNNEESVNGGDYTTFSGTSASTPIAAGVAGLLLTANENLTPAQVGQILKDSCDKAGDVPYQNGTNLYFAHGRINAWKALATNSMPVNLEVSNDTVKNTRRYFSRGTLTATNNFVLKPSADVHFRGGAKIELKDGFKAEAGSTYRTEIDPSL